MSELVTFKVGEASPANTFLAIWMAESAGLYEKNGLDLEIVKVVGGRESGPDLAAGRLHLMHIGMSSVVRANAAGATLVTIGSLSNIIRNTMFTAPGVTCASDLKGKIVGISSAGSETDSTTTLALHKLDLTRRDVIIREIGVQRLTAVRTGEVGASLLGEPDRSRAFGLGLHAIVDLYAERTPWLYSGLVVHRDFLKTQRDCVLRFTKATIEGNYLAVSDEKRAKAVLARKLSLADPNIIDIGYANFRSETPINAEMSRDGATNVIAIVADKDASHNVDDYMDTSILDELSESGFFAAMQTKYAGPHLSSVRQ